MIERRSCLPLNSPPSLPIAGPRATTWGEHLGRPAHSSRAWAGAALDPHVVLRRALTAFLSGVGHAARLDQEELHLGFGVRLVLHPFRHHEHLARAQCDRAVPEIDAQRAVDDDEALVGVLVVVPDEVALQPDDLE